MKNRKGQTILEMTFIVPLFLMLAAAMLFFVYVGWQELKIQQAANVLARVEGQEKVSGGVSIGQINQENGFGPGTGIEYANATVGDANLGITNDTPDVAMGTGTLLDRLKSMLKGLYPNGGVSLGAPRSGQNIDQINVFQTIKVPKIPFLKGNAGLPETINIKGTAYGGEDPFMYALPRWGTIPGHGDAEWRRMLKSAADHSTD